ncbi:hypothetical protein GDO86_020521 [Hymenochirus boettgeri]|uniref:Uncharacterized protein n=1 Tax=Hymenochirus boettgeri TaxID=247094 RepID=A0A8T2INH2_9PIPI|nr:hypothetical protein GDO86_020521 [Hymenochirus boettgeri]
MGAVMVVRHQMDIVYVTRQKDQDTTEEDQREKEIIFQEVERRFPVGVEGDPPSVNVCRTINELHGQYCHDRWRRQQKKMRICGCHCTFQVPQTNQTSDFGIHRKPRLDEECSCGGRNPHKLEGERTGC